ncbi:protein CFAP20DC [Polymixia lowei]
MFKSIYQGGPVVELFSAQGKDPVAKWKLHGGPSAIHKEFDTEVKGFVYCLEGSSQTVKMQMPEDSKTALGLIQRFLVLQVNFSQCRDFSIELVITDLGHLKRRLYLSTVHKEFSATPLHARIPFVALQDNVWCNLCIDLVSFTGELFKSASFLTLDGITVSANCKLRRIFTMKIEPTGKTYDDMFSSGTGLLDLIPRSCQFPADVCHVTRVLDMERVWQAAVRTGLVNSNCAPDQSAASRLASSRKPRIQDSSHIAFGSRVSGPPPQTGRKNSGPSDGMDGPNSSARTNQKGTAESQCTGGRSEKSHGKVCHTPHNREMGFEVRDEALCYGTSAEGSPGAAVKPAESFRRSPGPATRSSDPQVWTDLGESDEGSEPRLSPDDEVFAFSSQPHAARRGQGRGDQGEAEKGDYFRRNGERRDGAALKDDFAGSESDEDSSPRLTTGFEFKVEKDKFYTKFPCSSAATPRSPGLTAGVHLNVQAGSNSADQPSSKELSPTATSVLAHPPSRRRADPAGTVPTRCLSPSGSRQDRGYASQASDQKGSKSLCRRFLREVSLEDSRQHKEDDDQRQEPVGSSSCDLRLLGSLRMQGDDEEELRMLASLRREQEEEEERGAPGLSASRIRQCNVSVGASSDDTCTWTRLPAPTSQGHHYQKEMNPLLHSNPREWMDVLSPPIIPASQRKRTDDTSHHHKDLIRGRDVSVNDGGDEEYLNLLYDPCLNCYFDPQTGKYYELVGLRLHPGIIASVIFVTLSAIAAAVLIIKKYCFPLNEATYRYSLLRHLEEQGPAEEDNDQGPCTVGEESDEDLLE